MSRTSQATRPRSRPLPAQFRLLWGAIALSNIGDGLRIVALPLLATSVTDDPRLIAGVTVAERLAWLLFILPGGAWADRFDRRRLRMRVDTLRALVMAALVVLVLLDSVSIWIVFVVAALLASGEAVVDSSSMAMVPALVDGSDLERAGARLTSTELVTNDLVGPPLGGLLFGLAVAIPFGVDAVTFAGAAIVMSFMSGSFHASASASTEVALRSQISEGFRWLWGQPLLRRLALISFGLGTSSLIGNGVFVIFARDELGLSEFGYGLLLVPGAFGGIVGSFLAPRLRRVPLRSALTGAVLASGGATFVYATSSSPVVVALLAATSLGAVMVWNVLTVALRQRLIPDELLGRVGASYRFVVYAGMPLGAFLGGIIANEFGVRTSLLVSGSCLVAIGSLVPVALRGVGEYDTR